MKVEGYSKRPARRLGKSHEWLTTAQRIIPGGAQTFSKSPRSFVQGVAPNFLSKAKGCYVWDVDGNRYCDYIMGLGPVILGHADPVVNEAVRAQLEDGVSFSLPHPIEVEVAQLLCELIPCAEMVRFGKNGSDVTAAAVRVSRAFTGRDKVACCGYHGWQDWYIGSTNRHRGVPEAIRKLTLPFPYNDLNSLHHLFREHMDQIACVIMEPVMFNPPQPGYLEEVKNLCKQMGAILVFDEIVTGFRLDLGGAQRRFGVVPDLACFGKAMANGFPLAALVGRAEVLRLFEDVFFSFTFGGEAASLAACRATIKELQRRQGIEHLWRIGTRLQEDTNAVIDGAKLTGFASCVGLGPLTGIQFHAADEKEQLLLKSLFQQEALKRQILTLGTHALSLAHDDAVVETTTKSYQQVFEIIAEAVRRDRVEVSLEGPPVRPILRQA